MYHPATVKIKTPIMMRTLKYYPQIFSQKLSRGYADSRNFGQGGIGRDGYIPSSHPLRKKIICPKPTPQVSASPIYLDPFQNQLNFPNPFQILSVVFNTTLSNRPVPLSSFSYIYIDMFLGTYNLPSSIQIDDRLAFLTSMISFVFINLPIMNESGRDPDRPL